MPHESDADRRRRESMRAGLRLTALMCREADLAAPAWQHPVPAPDLLAWLRRLLDARLHTPAAERALAGWLGADVFGLRRLPAPPPFLAGVDLAALPPAHVGPLLRRLSLTRAAPTAADLTPAALDTDTATVFRARRPASARYWGQPAATVRAGSEPGLDGGSEADPAPGPGRAPALPETVEIPFVVHGIWVGQPMPQVTAFRDHYAAAARRFPEATIVLWTDIPRARAAAVLADPDAPPSGVDDPFGDARQVVRWARDAGVALVNVHEVFHAEHPLYLHPQYVLEMTKQRPRGYTSATDHLRVELVHTFGGLYIDGDIRFDAGPDPAGPHPAGPDGAAADLAGPASTGPVPASLPELFAAVAASTVGFTLNVLPSGVSNDVILGPARHPALRLWMECARVNYFRHQRVIAGGFEAMTRAYVGQSHHGLRHLAPHRTGRVHHHALDLLGITRDDLVPTAGAVVPANEVTWVPRSKEYADIRLTGDSFIPVEGRPAGRDEVLERVMGLATFLIWQLVAREGNLYLSAVEPVVAALPDPDAVWIGLLRFLASVAPVRTAVTSITAQRVGENGAAEHLWLPPEAEALLDRTASPPTWFGRDPAADVVADWMYERLAETYALDA
ncbi:hypothetical protein, partial [Frankia canadensis]|uniref:hypothetical protein n=1 Tax=Frankia canadensis TaxID=1836972 RepID=UPI001054FB21